MMLAAPPHGPSDSMYLRITGPAVDADPASARPNPSRMVFFPRAITFSGMSSYFVFTINSETYFVRPGALANSSAGFGGGTASRRSLPVNAKPAKARELLQKSRRIIWVHPFRVSAAPAHSAARPCSYAYTFTLRWSHRF